jgi:hypothetical protein
MDGDVRQAAGNTVEVSVLPQMLGGGSLRKE